METSSCSFSVEQVELIRRLRNSGITCQQLIEAFQSLERFDARFGNIFNNPAPQNLQHVRIGAANVSPSISTQPNRPLSPRAPPATTVGPHNVNSLPALRMPVMAGISGRILISPTSQQLRTSSDLATQGNALLASQSQQLADVLRDPKPYSAVHSHNGHLDLHHPENDQSHGSTGAQNGPGGGHARSHAADLTADQCLILLQCTSEDKVIEFVKKCLLSADFRPVQQAQDIGVSEAAMQAFLWGDVFSIEQNPRNKLLEWIIRMFHHTDWFTAEMAKLLHLQGCGDGFDVQFTPRRERFTFRERHLDVLEAFWRRKQYPTFEEKEQIADDCNYAMALEVQRALDEKEKVTHVNVANWFKNKRKEIKRVTKKENNPETVKNFLDSLNARVATSTELTPGEMTFIQQRLAAEESARPHHSDLPSNPDSSSGSSGSSSGCTSTATTITATTASPPSVLTKSEVVTDASSMQVVFPSYSNLVASYPVSQAVMLHTPGSRDMGSFALSSVTDSGVSVGMATLSPDSSSAATALKTMCSNGADKPAVAQTLVANSTGGAGFVGIDVVNSFGLVGSNNNISKEAIIARSTLG